MHDPDNDDEIRRQNYERLFGTTVEREAEARELAERQARNKREEVMAYARKLAAEREERLQREARGPTDEHGRPLNDPRYKLDAVVTKSLNYGMPETQRAEWQRYIDRRVKKEALAGDKVLVDVVVETIGKDLVAVERRCDALEQRAADLEKELDRAHRMLRAQSREDEVNERLRQYDVLAERLQQLEAQSSRALKVVGYG